MKNRFFWLIGLLVFIFAYPNTATAGTIDPVQPRDRLLLVYDSLAVEQKGDEMINLMQSLLTSLQVSVTTLSIDDYQTGQLADYTGLIEIINQPDLPIDNQTFLKERELYQKKRLHIGQNLPESWRQVLGSPLKRLYDSASLDSLTFQASENLQQNVTVDVLVDDQHSKSYGSLNYNNELGRYPYGSLQDGVAYLPFWQTTGLPYLIGNRVICEWLGINQVVRQYPLLVFDDFTPVSDFGILRTLQQELQAAGLPFAISATGIWDNLDTKAANNYLEILTEISTQNSSLFLQTPFVQNSNREDQHALQRQMATSLTFFLENKVYPVGIATPAYWNQDADYQEQALNFADTTILLPNRNRQERLKATTNQLYQTAYVGFDSDSFRNIDLWGVSEKVFFSPTAIVIPFPETEERLERILTGLTTTSYLFENTLYTDHRVVTNSHTLEVKNQQFFLDGQRKWIESAIPFEAKAVAKPDTSLTSFFATQNKILTVFITGTLIVLGIFLIISYVLYRRKYGR
ncbi:hypothetical protein I6N95_00500 [Vagococcus sp. BWB3-3]|uniref:NodB homology domain-containing protein n=1 Tax=Vagococcus allomyrinae TaxID=2794353 RepID=A0A940P6P5_9ENTE|nr:hypothetical protein [Vagococcus allomyrinae]MBP1039474.1 hypothetical protein [Vagococcus allomyrinae]